MTTSFKPLFLCCFVGVLLSACGKPAATMPGGFVIKESDTLTSINECKNRAEEDIRRRTNVVSRKEPIETKGLSAFTVMLSNGNTILYSCNGLDPKKISYTLAETEQKLE